MTIFIARPGWSEIGGTPPRTICPRRGEAVGPKGGSFAPLCRLNAAARSANLERISSPFFARKDIRGLPGWSHLDPFALNIVLLEDLSLVPSAAYVVDGLLPLVTILGFVGASPIWSRDLIRARFYGLQNSSGNPWGREKIFFKRVFFARGGRVPSGALVQSAKRQRAGSCEESERYPPY